jgi:predicted DNA-binding protein (MmcQ/YjbR family)
LKRFRAICLRLPECQEGSQFGYAAWLAGKKTFAIARPTESALTLLFWVGVDQQGILTTDPRYKIPPYMGHNGWISLDVSAKCDWDEIESLALQSYRHFALQRMLRELGDV